MKIKYEFRAGFVAFLFFTFLVIVDQSCSNTPTTIVEKYNSNTATIVQIGNESFLSKEYHSPTKDYKILLRDIQDSTLFLECIVEIVEYYNCRIGDKINIDTEDYQSYSDGTKKIVIRQYYNQRTKNKSTTGWIIPDWFHITP